PVKSCNKSNGVAASGATNVCFASSGTANLAYSCSSYQPIIVNSTFSCGFAGHGSTATATCCKCFEFTWTSGAAAGKSMIVQAINAGGENLCKGYMHTPGGGIGDYNGCTSQYGAPSGGGAGNTAVSTQLVPSVLNYLLTYKPAAIGGGNAYRPHVFIGPSRTSKSTAPLSLPAFLVA
ncbi:glycoside hydrolase family 45 protein, partial [Jaapia argillacea MUCL 33604]